MGRTILALPFLSIATLAAIVIIAIVVDQRQAPSTRGVVLEPTTERAPTPAPSPAPGQWRDAPVERPSIPPHALTNGAVGECDVTFDVLPDGRVTNPQATCTDPAFAAEVERDALTWRLPPPEADSPDGVLRGQRRIVRFRPSQ